MEYNSILIDRMKKNLKNPPNKIEGSFAIDNIETVAVELSDIYSKIEEANECHFLDTAKGEYLDRKALDYGVFRKKSQKAKGFVTFLGENGTRIDKGCIVSSENIEYITTENVIIENLSVKAPVIAVKSGSDSNVPERVINKIVTIDKVFYTSKKPTVINELPILNGTNDEHDENFRERIYFKIQSPATSGNIAHYKIWAESVDGVGIAKVTPLVKGAGTVGIVIINSNNDVADEELIMNVKNYIANDETGGGMAPIGAKLYVSTAKIKKIDINVTLTLKENVLKENVITVLKNAIQNYFKKTAFRAKNISLAKVTDIIFDNENVIDLENLMLNQSTINVKLQEDEIAKLGNFEVNYA